jgi:hypothetical protein
MLAPDGRKAGGSIIRSYQYRVLKDVVFNSYTTVRLATSLNPSNSKEIKATA